MKSKGLFLIFWLTFIGYSQQEITEKGELPSELKEISGMEFSNGQIIAHNDSGNTAELFVLDSTTLAISRRVSITNASNKDWEDIAQDQDYFYVGDIGNNRGNRQDLVIYKISKADFFSSDTVMAERIDFSYEDQERFETEGETDWDAEALLATDDALIIFTKQWKSHGVAAYTIPKDAGTYTATWLGEYAINGLITGITAQSNPAHLLAIGYSNFLSPFVVSFNNVSASQPFGDTVVKSNLDIGLSQIEAIARVGEKRYFIGAEEYSNAVFGIDVAAKIYAYTLSETEETEGETENPEEEGEEETPVAETQKEEIILFKEARQDTLAYVLGTTAEIRRAAIFDVTGKKVKTLSEEELSASMIQLHTLKSGIYYLAFYLNNKVIARAFVRDK